MYLRSNRQLFIRCLRSQHKHNTNTHQQDWSPSADGGYEVSTATSRDGAQSIMVTNGGATQTVTLPAGSGVSGSTITFGGYSRAVGTGTNLFHDYAISADVTYTDGTEWFGEAAIFQGGTTDGVGWVLETRSFAVPEGKTVASIDLSVLYRNDPTPNGVVYFDDVFVHMAERTGGANVRLVKPGAVIQQLPRIDLARIAGVEIENTTIGEPGRATRVFPDGSYDSYVKLAPGENVVRVRARGKNGGERVVEQRVRYDPREAANEEEARTFAETARSIRTALQERTLETELSVRARERPAATTL